MTAEVRRFPVRLDLRRGAVDMSHGSGGRAMAQLIEELFHRHLANDLLLQGDDQATFEVGAGRLVMSTDGHVISPLFFPGGDIGALAVHGTVNDVAMAGAEPLYLAAAFILEEGFPLTDLERIVASMAAAAAAAGVPVVTGDTKVVERGSGDGVFITTTGVGRVPDGVRIAGNRARPGDAVLVSGTLGDHGVAIMSSRENLEFETAIESDTAALHGLVAAMVAAVPGIHCLRDPTRGGLATTLNELAHQSGVGMTIREAAVPVREQVAAACELLGLDPLYVANEGKLVAICDGSEAGRLLEVMRHHPLGRGAAVIGEVVEDPHGLVQMETAFGGQRVVDWLAGEQLPPDLLMRILFLCHAFNSLSQRLFVELRELGHEVSVELDVSDTMTVEAVELFRPDLVVAPFLKRAIPAAVWQAVPCFVVHPGPPGDRGPAALDWALLEDEPRWGVTVLQATAAMDAGPVWASVGFPMRAASKSSLYRREVTEAAVAAVRMALERFTAGGFTPEGQDDPAAGMVVRERPAVPRGRRTVHWQTDDTATVLRKIRSAEGVPGVRDVLAGRTVFLHDARPEGTLKGRPGDLLARSGPAVCRATADGAVWLGHLREPAGELPFKLPAVRVLGEAAAALPEAVPGPATGYRDVVWRRRGPVGYLHFDFYNGAMGVDACNRLREAWREAAATDVRVLVLMGGEDFWSNGMDLNRIEAAASPPEESWANINAMNDLAREVITTADRLTVAALGANAGAGGVFLSRAADRVWARRGVVLNPHYKDMGNLYGSEYWTYQLPRYAGADNAARISKARLPMGVTEAAGLGLVDRVLPGPPEDFRAEVERRALELANAPDLARQLTAKAERRRRDEAERPLEDYRATELEHMRLNFFGFDPSYHVARYNFVHKVPKSHTPLTIARHRRRDWRLPGRREAS